MAIPRSRKRRISWPASAATERKFKENQHKQGQLRQRTELPLMFLGESVMTDMAHFLKDQSEIFDFCRGIPETCRFNRCSTDQREKYRVFLAILPCLWIRIPQSLYECLRHGSHSFQKKISGFWRMFPEDYIFVVVNKGGV